MMALPKSRYFAYFALASVGVAIDLATKSWVFGRLGLPGSEILWIWPEYFGLETSLNEGALFGMGQGYGLVFAAFSVAAILGVIYWLFYLKAAQSWLLTVSLGMITGGILGNLYDRLGLHGLTYEGEPILAVRDWILVQWTDAARWPNFNIADSLLVSGATLLMWHAFTAPPVAEPSTATPSADKAA